MLSENLERWETAVAASLVIAISVVVITLVLNLGSGIGLYSSALLATTTPFRTLWCKLTQRRDVPFEIRPGGHWARKTTRRPVSPAPGFAQANPSPQQQNREMSGTRLMATHWVVSRLFSKGGRQRGSLGPLCRRQRNIESLWRNASGSPSKPRWNGTKWS